MTLASPPSITATQELVVPRSIPMTLPMKSPCRRRQTRPGVRAEPASRAVGYLKALVARGVLVARNLNRNLPRLHLLCLGNANLEDAVLVRRRNLVALHGRAELEATLEGAMEALHAVPLHVFGLRRLAPLAAHRERVLEHRDLHVLGAQSRQIHAHEELIPALANVDRGRPLAALRGPAMGQRIEETVHLVMHFHPIPIRGPTHYLVHPVTSHMWIPAAIAGREAHSSLPPKAIAGSMPLRLLILNHCI